MSGAKKKSPQEILLAAQAAATVASDAVETAKSIADAAGATEAHKKAAAVAVEKATKADDAVVEALAVVAATKAAVKKPPYEIGKGHAVTATRKRVLAEGDPVTVADMEGGRAAFDGFVKSGLIVKNN